MGKRADNDSLRKFLQDRELLPYTDAVTSARMGMDRSNFSSYVNGHLPITTSFLRRFYSVFGNELVKKEGTVEPLLREVIAILKHLDLTQSAILEALSGKTTGQRNEMVP